MASRVLGLALALAFALGAGPAVAGKAKTKRVPNMPRGWSWPPNPAMIEAGERCVEALGAHEVVFEPGQGKKVATPIVLPQMDLAGIRLEPTWRKGPFVMDCHLALAVHDLAPQLRALGVEALRFSTIHDFRYVKRRGRKTNILSRHAIGLAMDVFEVRFSDTTLVVKKDYGERLAAVEQVFATSALFRNPLSPGNDPKGHDDHLHLEARMPLRRDSR